ncbi:MAG: peptidase E [Clostridiaceae bacterium]|nr:peptidase E [Clostridiaceae bacterium]
MGKIVAVGGGELRRGETAPLDRLIGCMAGRAPRLLFLPTASGDAPAYIETVKTAYGALGCETDALCLFTGAPTDAEVRRKVAWADAVYVGGGDTEKMMVQWRLRGVDALLADAYRRGAVMAGISAGAICWFEFGPGKDSGGSLWDFARVYGLGLIPAACCPHYSAGGNEEFDRMIEGQVLPGIALGDKTAFVEEDGAYRIVKADPDAEAFLIYTLRGELVKRSVEDGKALEL